MYFVTIPTNHAYPTPTFRKIWRAEADRRMIGATSVTIRVNHAEVTVYRSGVGVLCASLKEARHCTHLIAE